MLELGLYRNQSCVQC